MMLQKLKPTHRYLIARIGQVRRESVAKVSESHATHVDITMQSLVPGLLIGVILITRNVYALRLKSSFASGMET